jgi:hypothetical protein
MFAFQLEVTLKSSTSKFGSAGADTVASEAIDSGKVAPRLRNQFFERFHIIHPYLRNRK